MHSNNKRIIITFIEYTTHTKLVGDPYSAYTVRLFLFTYFIYVILTYFCTVLLLLAIKMFGFGIVVIYIEKAIKHLKERQTQHATLLNITHKTQTYFTGF